MELKDAVTGLSALAHEGRLSVLRLLMQAGQDGLAAGEIARRIEVLPNTLSANLSVLSHAGLIEPHREGRSIIYTASYPDMLDLLGYLIKDCCAGRPEIQTALAALAGLAA